VPSPTSTPTAALSSSQTEATNLAAEAKAGLAAAANASAGNGVKTPFGVQTAALPSGVTATLQCSLLGAGGTGSITYDAPTALATGSTFVITYNACGFAGYAYNGTVNMVFDRYASPTDFAYTVSYQNFTVSGNGLSNQTVSGKASCSYTNGAASCYYNDGTRGWSSTMTYTNGTVNGSYAVNYGSGAVTVSYSNFGATGGTATITGANGSKAVITRNSATSFTVSITTATGAASTAYTVTL
jgi:hypothetical protein